jgi:hypothetical protein
MNYNLFELQALELNTYLSFCIKVLMSVRKEVKEEEKKIEAIESGQLPSNYEEYQDGFVSSVTELGRKKRDSMASVSNLNSVEDTRRKNDLQAGRKDRT